eukprot:167515-Amphidinium_carterae.1
MDGSTPNCHCGSLRSLFLVTGASALCPYATELEAIDRVQELICQTAQCGWHLHIDDVRACRRDAPQPKLPRSTNTENAFRSAKTLQSRSKTSLEALGDHRTPGFHLLDGHLNPQKPNKRVLPRILLH